MITDLSSYRRQIGSHHNRQLQPDNANRNPASRNDRNNAYTAPSRRMPLLITGLLLTSQIAQALAVPLSVARGQHGPSPRGAGALRTVRQTCTAPPPSESFAPAAPVLDTGRTPRQPVFPCRSDRDNVFAQLDLVPRPDEAKAPPARAAARKKRLTLRTPELVYYPGCEPLSGRLNLTLPASQCRPVTASDCPARPPGRAVASPARVPFSRASR